MNLSDVRTLDQVIDTLALEAWRRGRAPFSPPPPSCDPEWRTTRASRERCPSKRGTSRRSGCCTASARDAEWRDCERLQRIGHMAWLRTGFQSFIVASLGHQRAG